ncbi:MAG: DUF2339 domain-containing protein [Rhodoplanes sp.]|uniref:DUF2339 domain-containing protein n=1 Tax=Rhodoplanes sp. TaxID=1968906 RepID=UPI001804EEEF|nr:DUF2339 domain-containing protein [Rhodoplanes sp.]NVO15826.1 DUF2339 domain-containing protein [Rhodoplanes sp.]
MEFLALLAAVAAIILAWGERRRIAALRARLIGLEQQVAALRDAGPRVIAAGDAAMPSPESAPQRAPEAAAPPEPVAEPISVGAIQPAASEAIPEAPPPLVPPEAAPEPVPARGFEERFGTQWVVWVGGVALALGGIFLVRYSIEQGLIGPGVRVMLGALLAIALIAAGEWTRRNELRSGIGQIGAAHIPSILTAAGTTVAYATVYAAYALYGFLAPPLAFLLLGIVALATLAAALLHGPALAGLGLVGAYVTPVLVSTEEPSFWALYLYLIVVTAAAFALARAKLWRWLAVTALCFATLWTLPGIAEAAVATALPHTVYVVIGFALAAAMIVAGLLFGPAATPDTIDEISSLALAAWLVPAALLTTVSGHDSVALTGFVLLVLATVGIAQRSPAALAAVPVAAGLAVLVMAEWATETRLDSLIAPAGPVAGVVPEPERASFTLHLLAGFGFAALFGLVGFFAQGRSERSVVPQVWAWCAIATPVAVLIALYWRIAGFDRSIPFAGLALLLAALFAVATETLGRRPSRPGLGAGQAIFAVGAVAALALALTMALEKGFLTIALALTVAGIAFVERHRPLPALRYLAAGVALVVLARIGWEPRIVGDAVGTTPIFNWLLWGYGVPALAFWTGGHLLRKRADDGSARTVDTLAILFTVLLVSLEIRHTVQGGDVYRMVSPLTEVGLQVSAWLALAIGLERVRLRTGSIVHNVGAVVMAVLALAGIAVGLVLLVNPVVTGDAVGGPVVNLVLLGYGLPAVLATVLALVARDTRPMAYRAVAATAAVGLSLLWLSLEIRRAYHGAVLTVGPTTDVEQYTYSAAWLAFGVVLLLAGILLRSQPARLASAAVVTLTIAKVFLYDMAGLTGIFRALSFIGLGLVLVGIGLLYQRLLFPRRPARPPAAPAPGGMSAAP